LIATLAGVLMALWLRYVGPKTMLSFDHHDRHPADRRDRRHGHALRRGNRFGAVHPDAELPAGPDEAGAPMAGAPLLANLFHPDRWLFWLGVLFVLSVYFFPPASSASCAPGRRPGQADGPDGGSGRHA
jgi:branched-chain amino acid transport system permease protein